MEVSWASRSASAKTVGNVMSVENVERGEVADRNSQSYDNSVDRVLANMGRALDGGCSVAGLAGVGGVTLSGFQKFRKDWVNEGVVSQIKICRAQVDTNWFVGMVHEARLAVHVSGFSFEGDGAKIMVGMKGAGRKDRYRAGTVAAYPWGEVVKDVMSDYLAVDNVVALWRKGQDELPHITILDAEVCQYKSTKGCKQITLRYDSDSSLFSTKAKKSSAIRRFGKEMAEAMAYGREITIIKGENDDWDIDVLAAGKRKETFAVPSMVAILDDLDFVEMLKIGDWNGAYTRKDILRIATKGYGIKSGSGAGRSVGDAKPKHLKKLSAGLRKVMGLTNLALNWDTAISHEYLSSEFFGEHRSKDALKRLVAWGGLEAALLMDGFSQVSGVSPYMARLWRPRVRAARRDVGEFCARIFNNPSFRNIETDVVLVPEFDEGVLYNTEELTRLVEHQLGHAVISIDTARERHGVDSEKEKARIKESHDHLDENTPVHEPRQGIVSQMRNNDDDDGGGGGGGGKAPASGSTDKGGRPANI